MKARKPLILFAFILLVVALSVAVATAACGSEAVTSSETTATTGPGMQSATSKAATAPPASLLDLEALLPNGHSRGLALIRYIPDMVVLRQLRCDYVEMLTGEEARQAAIEDGVISPDEELPGDYYIRNEDPWLEYDPTNIDDPDSVGLVLPDTVSITTLTFDGGPEQTITLEQFLSFWDPLAPPSEESERLRNTPWWIERDQAGKVVSITEQPWP